MENGETMVKTMYCTGMSDIYIYIYWTVCGFSSLSSDLCF